MQKKFPEIAKEAEYIPGKYTSDILCWLPVMYFSNEPVCIFRIKLLAPVIFEALVPERIADGTFLL